MDTLLALDVPYVYYRSFFGIPDRFHTDDGTPVNAVRGVLDTIAALVTRYGPTHVAAAWDEQWRPVWRTDLVPSYKTHRVASTPEGSNGAEDIPEGLGVQVPIIHDLLADLGLVPMGVADHEADDVLGSLATSFRGESLVVTGDRDLFQLVDATTRVLWIAKGVAKLEEVDESWMDERVGVPASRYVDYAVLRGDPSDGLPGVKGVGEKTAVRLVAEHESLKALRDAAEDESSAMALGLRRKVLAAADYLEPARRVVQVVRDLDVASPARLPLDVDVERMRDLQERLNLGSSMDRVLHAVSAGRVQ